MSPRRWVVLVCLVLCGCRTSQQPLLDPFLGRTTVPPPATGQASPAPPYAAGAHQGADANRPGEAAAFAAQTQDAPADPRSGQASDAATRNLVRANDATGWTSAEASGSDSAGSNPGQTRRDGAVHYDPQVVVVGRDEETDRFDDAEPFNGEVRIPEPGGSDVARAARPLADEPAFDAATVEAARRASNAMVQPQSAGQAASLRDAAEFAHDTNYTWLKGRLEYVEQQERWLLRYQPEGVPPDQFGGVVTLPEVVVDSEMQPGDFVAVQGKIYRRDPDDPQSGLAFFDVERIKPLAGG